MTHNEISGIVVDTALKIHWKLGPGLLESVYKILMRHELMKRGLDVQYEVPIPIMWDGFRVEVGFRSDLIVERKVLLELKSVEAVLPVHKKQLLTYLKLTNMQLGLLMNFNEPLMKDGIYRVANDLADTPQP